MQKYYLYLDSYTFVFLEERTGLIYNSLSGNNYEFEITNRLKVLISELIKPSNNYCLEINSSIISHSDIQIFINGLINSFSGGVIRKSLSKSKPVVFSPILNIQTILAKQTFKYVHEKKYIKEFPFSYLKDLTIYINSECNNNCIDCQVYLKQFTYCKKGDGELSFEIFNKILIQLNNPIILRIIGGDIFKYHDIDNVVKLLNNSASIIRYYSHFRSILSNFNVLERLVFSKSSIFHILVDNNFYESALYDCIKFLDKIDVEYILNFVLTDLSDFKCADSFLKYHGIKKFEYLPFFNQLNLDFFRNEVFLKREDIFGKVVSKEDIFANKTINRNFFGKLIVNEKADVFVSMNQPSIGSLYNASIFDLVQSCTSNGSLWLRIRDREPCINCRYRFLCPPPSNYELVFGYDNLCYCS